MVAIATSAASLIV
uniref:Uncharacterized protein n=1 Tax=Arundo donax TaxID=35708 RepID=A0A0A9HIE3_ARUDO